MRIKKKNQKIGSLLDRGVERVINKEILEKNLNSGRPLVVKHGVDPTGPNIHLGRAAQLMKLKDFQDLGHKVVLIIGDFTAQIGDASDKQAMRRPLSKEEVKRNIKGYLFQVGKIISIKKAEIRYNSEWFGKMNISELLSFSMKFTAQQVIQRRNFKERWEKGKAIGLHELFYPLLQGYDSFKVKADVEIGGFDQLFNLKTGRDIQSFFGQNPQNIMVLKMIYGLDGRKMSTSWGNTININDSPEKQFGGIMSMKDELIADYFTLCTRVPMDQISKIKNSLKKKKENPRNIKSRLAKEIVSTFHGEKAALKAEKEFNSVFRGKGIPSKVPNIEPKNKKSGIADFLAETGILSSKSEARRIIEQGGVKINGRVSKNWKENFFWEKGTLIQVGKRKFFKIK